MSALSDALARLLLNEARFNDFINQATGTYTTSEDVEVPVLQELVTRLIPTVTIGIFQYETPEGDYNVMRYIFAEAATFPADFAGSLGHNGIFPAAPATMDVQKNGVTCGTISIATDGTITFETDSNAEQSFAIGDLLDVVSQSEADETLALITITLLAYKD